MAEIFKNSLFLFGDSYFNTTSSILDNSITMTADEPTAIRPKKDHQLVDEMLWNMRVVSFICNFWTMILTIIVIYQLAREIVVAKKSRDKKRSKLYFTSILFVSYVNTLCIFN